VAALRRQRDAQDAAKAEAGSAWQDRDDLIFTDALGQPLVGTNVSHAFDNMLKSAGLPHVPFHALRHSAATALLAAGVPLRVVADQLGHSTIVVTANVYAAVVPELRREAADAMDKVLS
jgi:integrase